MLNIFFVLRDTCNRCWGVRGKLGSDYSTSSDKMCSLCAAPRCALAAPAREARNAQASTIMDS